MKRVVGWLIGLACVTLMHGEALSQKRIDKGSFVVTAGTGFQGNRFHTTSWRPSYHLLAEYVAFKKLSVGLMGMYYGEQMGKEFRFQSYSTGIRGTYYLTSPARRSQKKTYFYAGAGVMYYNFSYTGLEQGEGKLYVPFFLGVKHFISQDVGLNLEGTVNDMSFLKAGLFVVLKTKRTNSYNSRITHKIPSPHVRTGVFTTWAHHQHKPARPHEQ